MRLLDGFIKQLEHVPDDGTLSILTAPVALTWDSTGLLISSFSTAANMSGSLAVSAADFFLSLEEDVEYLTGTACLDLWVCAAISPTPQSDSSLLIG